MPHDLFVALCLVLVLEGLVLFAAPRQWQSMVRQALELRPRTLRLGGAVAVIAGLAALQLIR
ncbi:MAG TPA: DUF2065 family protein [Frateuria sp.]|uniref:DUF2065 family protein n=1 Tax=Frateuria sp. TaxID=2211372 RepID=UPI002DF3739B|nr:DUF2065 family protein [Frateuria sp.]